MKLSIAERDFLEALSFYLGNRRTAFRSALRLRAPLNAENAEDLRIHYANYFVSLMSAVDLICENKSLNPATFSKALALGFQSLNSSTSSGEKCLAYVRELRNAIVHRGLDIGSAIHFAGDLPLLIAPEFISDRTGRVNNTRFSYYILGIILSCEAFVIPTIESHLDAVGIFEKVPDVESWLSESIEFIEHSTVIPDPIKQDASSSISSIDLESLHRDRIAKLRELLKPLNFEQASQSQPIKT